MLIFARKGAQGSSFWKIPLRPAGGKEYQPIAFGEIYKNGKRKRGKMVDKKQERGKNKGKRKKKIRSKRVK